MSSIIDHVKLALRLLAKRPGLSAGRVLTVTIVVTAVSAVFTVANATFLRPLPFPHADRLVRIYLQPPGTTDFNDANPLNPLEFERFRERTRVLERFEGILATERAIAGDGDPESVLAGRASAGFFDLLGGTTVLGRVFTEDETASGEKLVVLSHGMWSRRFGSDRSVIGRVLLIDREPHTIVGVMRPGFEPAFTSTEFWTPLDTRHAPGRTTLSSVASIGLLRPGASPRQAVGDLEGILQSVKDEVPGMLQGWTAGVVDLRYAQFGTRRPAVLMLLGAVAALGLIAVANLANLTLADVMFRRSDFAVRAALGGSRTDLAAPEIAQSVLVAGIGGAAGLAGSAWLVPAMLSLDPSSGFVPDQVSLDWRVVLCGFGVATLVMLLAVAAPVLRLAGPRLASDVTAGSRRAIGGRAQRRARIALVVAQTAVALVLLSSGALVVTTFQRSARTNPGYAPDHLVTAQLRLTESAFPTDVDRATFVEQTLLRLRATPGVVEAGTTLNSFTVGRAFVTLVRIEDHPTPGDEPHTVQYRRVTPGYFEAMQIPLIAGRRFDRHDWVDGQSVAIVSRGFARQFWPGQDPIGRRIRRGASAKVWSVVVGVVGDVRDVAIDQEPADTLYTPYFQASNAAAPVGLVVRTAGDPHDAIAAIKRAVWDVDAKQPLSNIVTLEDFLAASLGPQRFRAMLVAVCGMLGLLLATIGTYGVTARAVVERTREVGIRLALGGSPLRVWWTLTWGSLRAVIAGAAAGTVAAVGAAAGLGRLLPEVHGSGWGYGAATAAVLVLIGAAASLIAARSATSVEPLIALRGD